MEACGGVPAGIINDPQQCISLVYLCEMRAGMATSVLSVWLGPENKYAFVEMCTPECATIALGLNGMVYRSLYLIGRTTYL